MRQICIFLAAISLVLAGTTPCSSKTNPFGKHLLEDRNAQWQIMAEKMSYSLKDTLYTAEGAVTITRNGQVLSADRAMYNNETGIAQVSGDVRLEVGGDLLTGEMGIFDLKNHYGQITQGTIFLRENNVYIRGTSMIRLGPDTYVVRGCRVTTCDGEVPDWSITGSEVKVTLEGYGTVKHAAFRIKDFPIFYIPFAVFPVKTKRQTGLLPPRIGYSERNGVDLEVPFFWAISEQTDATFYERYIGKRGFMQGLEFRYLTKDDSQGVFLFDILSDKMGDKDLTNHDEVDISPFDRTNKTRYWLRSRTDQKFPGGIEARLDTDFVSDQDYLKEFRGGLYGFQARPDLKEMSGRPVEEIYSPTRRSALRLSRDGDDYSLQALASYHQRPENPPHDNTAQPLLGLNFSVLQRSMTDAPLFMQIDAEHDYVWREEGLKGHSTFISPGATFPVRLGPYAELEQSLAVLLDSQWYDDSGPGDGSESRQAYESKTRLSTALEKTFDFHWNDVKRLKHKIMPSLTYTYRGYNDADKFRPWFEPLDEEGKINTITLALENFLDARKENDKGEISYAQWAAFNVYQSYNIHEARRDEDPDRENQPLEPLVGVISLRPYTDLDFQATGLWDHYEDDISSADLSLELAMQRSGGRTDRFGIDYLYEKGGYNSLNYNIHFNLDHGFSLGTALKRDFDRRHNLERSYWLDYASQCWAIRLIAENLDDVNTFMVTFRLLGLEDIGSE